MALAERTGGRTMICGWLAMALAERTGGRTMICGWLQGSYEGIGEVAETDTKWYQLGLCHMDRYAHAGVLVGDRVYCAGGRSDPDDWDRDLCGTNAMCGLIEPEVLHRSILDPLPSAVADAMQDVVDLVVQLVGEEDEPRHPDLKKDLGDMGIDSSHFRGDNSGRENSGVRDMAEREPPNYAPYSDRQVAEDSMSMARSIRDGSDIRDVRSDMGKMLNVTVPALAARAGVELTAAETSVVADWEKGNGRPMNVHEARISVRMGSREGRENFGVGHPTFAEKGGLIPELVDRVERSEESARPVDRQTDVVLLAGLPDRPMAERALEHARDLRQGAALTERDGAVGDLLNRIVPSLANKLGVPIDDHERRVIMEHGEKAGIRTQKPWEKVEDMSETILHAARDGRRMFPESALFNAPEKGNIAAVMLDRMLRQEGIHQSMRPDGSLEPYPGPEGSMRTAEGVHGPEAVGAHAVARYMLERTAEMGHHPMPYWSPGHLGPPRDAGMFGKLLSKESLLEISDKQVYAERISRLPDTELAAELVEQAREMRERRPELAFAEHGYHRYMTWHGIPQMGALFGQTMRPDEVEKNPARVEDDQQAFNAMSSATMHGIGEGQAYVLRNSQSDPYHYRPTLSEKVMFNEPTHGSSMGMLLDRVAVALDAERGEETDRMGRAIAEVGRHRGYGNDQYSWKPDPKADDEVSLRRTPVREAERAAPEPERQMPAKGAMAAAFAAAGMGKGR